MLPQRPLDAATLDSIREAVLVRALEGEPERALLDAAVALGASAAAVWRRLSAAGSTAPQAERWLAVRTRGSLTDLPPDGVLVAALEGELAFPLPYGCLVLGGRSDDVGLVVAGLASPLREAADLDARLDLLEALVDTVVPIDAVMSEPRDLERPSAPLPSEPDTQQGNAEQPDEGFGAEREPRNDARNDAEPGGPSRAG